jgi:hypothetical protein
MGTVNPNRVGLVFGALLSGWHFLWALLVAVGWAQSVINFFFWIHFLKPPYTVVGFNAGVALILIFVTGAIGYATGYILGLLWNWIHR